MDNAKLTALYNRFVPGGYTAPTAQAPLAGLGNLGTPVGTPPSSPSGQPLEVPLLTPEVLKEIRAQLASEPDLTLELARRAIDGDMTLGELHQMLDQLDVLFANPELALATLDASGPGKLPAEFTFAGKETGPEFEARPNDHQFEDSDWSGYGLNVASAVLKRVFYSGKFPFRWEHEYSTRFIYGLKPNSKIALFSDFGTGLPHSYHIAKFLAAAQPDVAIHLGDVYYAGKAQEAQVNFDKPLEKLTAQTELFVLPGNHDYYSGGAAFFNGIDARRKTGRHRQQGSYFILDSAAFRIIGIDGEYHSGSRFSEGGLREWLQHSIIAGRTSGRSIILMSSDEPYSYDSSSPTDLYSDITKNLPPEAIDLWFWGNTHYCALFAPSSQLKNQFYGSCIGHGGYPYGRFTHKASSSDLAPILWAEYEPRFPAWTGVRQDMGNNGFMTLKLDDNTRGATLDYYDWTNALRATVTMHRDNKQLEVKSVDAKLRPLCK